MQEEDTNGGYDCFDSGDLLGDAVLAALKPDNLDELDRETQPQDDKDRNRRLTEERGE